MQRLVREVNRARRTRVVMKARLRIIGGKGFEAALIDLTAEGCSFDKPNVMLRERQQVAIKLETLDFITATVRWTSESAVGIEFDRPLYGPVVEHLLKQFPN